MRTIQEIKKAMTDEIMINEGLVKAMGLNPEMEWESQVSSVGIINLLLYVVAVAQYATEWMFEQFKTDVEKRIDAALPGTISWYWNKVMNFQYGTDLNQYGNYDLIDPSRMIVSHCSVLEVYNGIMVKVNKGDDFDVLDEKEKNALAAYLNRIKFAGTAVSVYSYQPDDLNLEIKIWRNPLVLNDDGSAVSGDGRNLIEEAVKKYLDGIVYGGRFNKTKLIDAIQSVEGVEDIIITSCRFKAYNSDATETELQTGVQNYTSICGHIRLENLKITEE
jgi:hypothetical protein